MHCQHHTVCLGVCFRQSPLVLQARLLHVDALQYPKAPCRMQSLFRCALLVQSHIVQRRTPPCLPQRPRAIAAVLHPTTEHFFPPPCFMQCTDPGLGLVVHSSKAHNPNAPCRTHRPLALAGVVHFNQSHNFLGLPPCFQHGTTRWHRACGSIQIC